MWHLTKWWINFKFMPEPIEKNSRKKVLRPGIEPLESIAIDLPLAY